jgi:hypothetical protein
MILRDFLVAREDQSPPHHAMFHVKQLLCRIEILLLIVDTLSVRLRWRFVAVNGESLPLRHERPD